MSAMAHARTTIALFLGLALGAGAASVACSDTDPRYGPPEAIRGRKIDYGVDVPAATVPTTDSGTPGTPTTVTPQELFNDLYATIQGVASEGTKCTPCHAPGGNGVTLFVGTSAVDSYGIFKAKGYQDLTKPNTFYTKGKHTGEPLTAPQQALAKKWADAELAAGAGAGTDAGGGG
jgi:hypothetical protein